MANFAPPDDKPAFIKALNAARNDEKGTLETTTGNTLTAAGTELWQKVERNPDTYVLSRDEFAIFNYYRKHYEKTPKNVPIVQRAVARFWDNYRAEDLASKPNLNSSAGRT